MTTILHQFANKDFYTPMWQIKHLFLGTFNPSNAEDVHYYYGRSKNQTWPLLSSIFNIDLIRRDEGFFINLRRKGISCLDLIHSVTVNEDKLDRVLGKGYSDNAIIIGHVIREYNTNLINQIIENNPDVKVYSTWGKGSQLMMEWKSTVAQINNVINLVSPSMAAKVPAGQQKFAYMLNDWSAKINVAI